MASILDTVFEEFAMLNLLTTMVVSGQLSLADIGLAADAHRARRTSRAQVSGRNIVGYFVAILIAGIVGVAVTVPIMQNVVSSANLTGMTATIANYIPTLLLVVFVVYVISPISGQ